MYQQRDDVGEEEEFNFDQNITVDDVMNGNNPNEVEDSGMEAGLDTDSEGDEVEETANEVDNSLVVLDPEHVSNYYKYFSFRRLICLQYTFNKFISNLNLTNLF